MKAQLVAAAKHEIRSCLPGNDGIENSPQGGGKGPQRGLWMQGNADSDVLGGGLAQVDAADDLAHGQDALGVHGKLVHTHPEEGLGEGGVRAQLAADADPDAVAVAGLNGHLDGLEHSWVVRVEEGFQLGVLAVQCAGVLGQVVGADGEEVALGGQVVGDEDGGGGLDHGADFDAAAELFALSGQLLLALFEDGLGVLQLPQAGDHGEHDAHVAVGRSAEQSPQLGLEEVPAGQADADGAVAQGGVVLMVELHVIDGLVGTDVTGADDDLLGGQALHHLLVGFELVVLGGEVLAVQVDEFGAEQAHAAGVVLLHGTHIAHAADVGEDVDGLAVQRGVGLALELGEEGELLLVFLLTLGQALQQIGGGVYIHAGVVAVHHGHLAVPVVLDLLALDQSGDVHAAGQNGGVAVGAALAGDEAQQQALVHPDRLGGGQILGHEDAWLCALQRGVVHALQDIQHGLRDVDDVGAAGLQIRVVHGGEDGGLVVPGGLDGVLGTLVLAVDDLLDGVHEVVVVQHHGMDVEHLGDVLTSLVQRLFVKGGLLVDGLGAGVFEAGFLGGGVGDVGGRDDDVLFLVKLQFANGDPVQDAFTGAYLHRSYLLLISDVRKSPRRKVPQGLWLACPQTFSVRNCWMAAAAASSSSPSTLTVTVSPCLTPMPIRAISLRRSQVLPFFSRVAVLEKPLTTLTSRPAGRAWMPQASFTVY